MNRIAVFCGANAGVSKIYRDQTYQLGRALAIQNINLVYGGSKTGLMGEIANGVLSNKGIALGVIPTFLIDRELAHPDLTELILVESMHDRKAKMNELADGFIVLPGGLGTMEEFFEMITWAQLGLHQKPILIFNIDGFYAPLITLIDQMMEKGFISKNSENFYKTFTSVEEIIKELNRNRQTTRSPNKVV